MQQAIEEYSRKFSLSEEDLRNIIFAKGKKTRGQHADFFPTIASSLEARPLIAVYNYVRRAYDPLGKKGTWTAEEDGKLANAIAVHGMNWGLVSAEVGRTKSDCRDRWRNHVSVRDTKNTGKWTPAEEEALRKAVKSVTTDKGRSADQDVFWSAVSKALGGSRSRAQCRIKWYVCGSLAGWTALTGGGQARLAESQGEERGRLRQLDPSRQSDHDATVGPSPQISLLIALTLVTWFRLVALGMTDDTGFDWKQVEDDTWGHLFSTHIMQVRWRRLKAKYQRDHPDLALPGELPPPTQHCKQPGRADLCVDFFRDGRIAREDCRTNRVQDRGAAERADPGAQQAEQQCDSRPGRTELRDRHLMRSAPCVGSTPCIGACRRDRVFDEVATALALALA